MNKCEISPKKRPQIREILAKKTEFYNKAENEILFEK